MENQTILLVDDECEILALVRTFLERAGYVVITAGDGEEGLRAYEKYQSDIDLLLTDVSMPKMNGIDLAFHVRQLGPRLPILFMSAETWRVDRSFACVQKPFKVDELILRLTHALGSSHRRTPSDQPASAANALSLDASAIHAA